jgi:hypothetical protein
MSRLGVHIYAPLKLPIPCRVLWTPDVEEIVPQVEMGVNPHVGLTQSHEGRDMQDPREGQ